MTCKKYHENVLDKLTKMFAIAQHSTNYLFVFSDRNLTLIDRKTNYRHAVGISPQILHGDFLRSKFFSEGGI